jgi:hypothetical protein
VWAFVQVENCWLFGVAAKKRLFRQQTSETLLHAKDTACDALENILNHDPRFLKHEWFAESPFELNVNEF